MSDHICLIVDDEPAIRTYLRSVLEAEGMQCIEAENAVDALRTVQRLGGHVDLIVTDVQMPGDMSGIDLAYSVAASFPRIAVILISGYADLESVRRAASVFRLIRKPFAVTAIVDAVRQTMAADEGGRFGINPTEADGRKPETVHFEAASSNKRSLS